ncbi:MAG: hypothetical protein JWQ91_1923 [Aeromicrobium sp.]|uniref:hypothetical protein n=1 Tax=Aeromicrobium sp. TaxID=1871063 RepID=UPI0026128754|nr:hypothetical protein [Aeromicrobium sp.]MCW2825006.1 hypothetical protein [Aeromicrobium sp.]
MTSLSRIMHVVGVLLLAVGIVAGVVNRQVVDGTHFAEHVDAIREDPQVAREVGLVVTDRVLAEEPDLTGLRPLIEAASATLVASSALGPVVRATVSPLYRALTSDDDDQVVLRLADVGALLVAAITTLAPDTKAVIPADLDVTLSSIGGQELTSDLIRLTDTVILLAWLLPLLGLALLAVAGALRRSGWRGVVREVGSGALAAAGALILLLVLASLLAARLDEHTLGGALGAATWWELDHSFWLAAALVAAAGFLLRVVASPGLDLEPAALSSHGWQSVTGAGVTPRAELVRAGCVLAVGAVAAVRPLLVVSFVASLVGVLLVLSGGRALRQVGAVWWSARATDPDRRTRRIRRVAAPTGAVLWGAALVVVLALGAWPADDDLPTTRVASGTACNGHDELCRRGFDEVAFAGTHNSMSAADQPRWFLAEQPHGILRQLDDGIRVLLIDSWDGQETQRPGVIANAGPDREKAIAEAERTYGRSVVESALRVRDFLSLTPSGPVRPYLCHSLCELGSTDWESLMVRVKKWLDRHPREVVTFFVQDEVSPADTAALVERAGLKPYVHTPTAGEPWPTLGEMISSGHRVVFLLENSGGGPDAPWLIDAREAVQDTPFDFTKASQFSCERFRGPKDAPLFLVNHWLSNVDSRVTDAATVNAEDVLLPRVRECERQRGQNPTFVAVDYYDRGDLLGVVDRLNGVP